MLKTHQHYVAPIKTVLPSLRSTIRRPIWSIASALTDFFVNHFDMAGQMNTSVDSIPRTGLSPLAQLYIRISHLPQITIGEIRGRTLKSLDEPKAAGAAL
jgi:hypothetical protein